MWLVKEAWEGIAQELAMKEWRKAWGAWVECGWNGRGSLDGNTLKAFEAGFHAGVISQTDAKAPLQLTTDTDADTRRFYPTDAKQFAPTLEAVGHVWLCCGASLSAGPGQEFVDCSICGTCYTANGQIAIDRRPHP